MDALDWLISGKLLIDETDDNRQYDDTDSNYKESLFDYIPKPKFNKKTSTHQGINTSSHHHDVSLEEIIDDPEIAALLQGKSKDTLKRLLSEEDDISGWEDNKIKKLWEQRKLNMLRLPWTFTKYGISRERLFFTEGFLTKKSTEVRLYRIKNVFYTQTIWQRILRTGDVTIKTNSHVFHIHNVPHPSGVKNLISHQANKHRKDRVRDVASEADDQNA